MIWFQSKDHMLTNHSSSQSKEISYILMDEILSLFFTHRDEVQDYSPLKNLELIGTRLPAHFPCLMAVGSDESEEFHRQGEEFHQV